MLLRNGSPWLIKKGRIHKTHVKIRPSGVSRLRVLLIFILREKKKAVVLTSNQILGLPVETIFYHRLRSLFAIKVA